MRSSSAAADGVAIRLAAPRRFGKTSLLDAHVASMQTGRPPRPSRRPVQGRDGRGRGGTRQRRRSAPCPATRDAAFGAGPHGWGHAKLAGVKLSLAPSAARPAADEARAALLELLDVPLGLHEQDSGLTVVCLDEFQDLLVADDTLDGLFRSVIQHHGGAAAYVFAGSQPSLMRALFSDRERPFYGQARPLELPVLPADEAARDIESLLAADGLGPRAPWTSCSCSPAGTLSAPSCSPTTSTT